MSARKSHCDNNDDNDKRTECTEWRCQCKKL